MVAHFSVNTVRDVTAKAIIDFHYPEVHKQISEEAKRCGHKIIYKFGRAVTEQHVKNLVDVLKHNGFTCIPKRQYGRWGDITHIIVSWR